MVEIQGAQLVAQALGTGAGQTPQPSAGAVDASQAARFRSLLESPEPVAANLSSAVVAASQSVTSSQSVVASQNVSVAQSVAASQSVKDVNATGAVQPASLGDSILHGLDKVRGNLNEQWATINRLLDPAAGPLTTANILHFQASMLQMGAEHQLISSVVAKSAQNIDQLVKMQ